MEAFSLPQQLPDVLGQHVGLDVDAVARPEGAEGGDGQGVGDQHHREAAGGDVDERQADAVDGDRPLGDHQRRPGRVEGEGEELPLAVGPAIAEGGRGVDVPLDEVAAEPVADPQGPLQVHRVAGRAVAQVRAEQGLRPGLDVEPVAPGSAATTVRQQPLTATLSPSASGSPRRQARPGQRQPPPESLVGDRSTRPRASTSPVNIGGALLGPVS